MWKRKIAVNKRRALFKQKNLEECLAQNEQDRTPYIEDAIIKTESKEKREKALPVSV